MKIADNYKQEYRDLRTCIFNLEMQLALQSKILSAEEIENVKTEIAEIKKKMCYLVSLSEITKNDLNGGNIK